MVSHLPLKSLLHLTSDQSEHNPLTMSDDQILEQIYSTHVHSDTKFDVDSLFTLVENTLRRSTHIVDNVVQVNTPSHFASSLFCLHISFCFTCSNHEKFLQGSQASLEHLDDKQPKTNFVSPLCTLKQISSEVILINLNCRERKKNERLLLYLYIYILRVYV